MFGEQIYVAARPPPPPLPLNISLEVLSNNFDRFFRSCPYLHYFDLTNSYLYKKQPGMAIVRLHLSPSLSHTPSDILSVLFSSVPPSGFHNYISSIYPIC